VLDDFGGFLGGFVQKGIRILEWRITCACVCTTWEHMNFLNYLLSSTNLAEATIRRCVKIINSLSKHMDYQLSPHEISKIGRVILKESNQILIG
jgi:hypothetical protein